jgi:hypothetical protein
MREFNQNCSWLHIKSLNNVDNSQAIEKEIPHHNEEVLKWYSHDNTMHFQKEKKTVFSYLLIYSHIRLQKSSKNVKHKLLSKLTC